MARPTFPMLRQLTGGDRLAMGEAARSARSETLAPRTRDADRVAKSICPIAPSDAARRSTSRTRRSSRSRATQTRRSPAARLCPKGSASRQLHASPGREFKVKYRRPHGAEWEELELETAMDMIADRLLETRDRTWRAPNLARPPAS